MAKYGACVLCAASFGAALLFSSCAAERQGIVCDEIEYRLNTMTYSPDQRAYAEEELRVCREEEAKKKGEAAAKRQSIYDRFASKDSSKSQLKVAEDGSIVPSEAEDVSVSKALKDSSGEQTTSIYERYGAMAPDTSAAAPADTAAKASAPAVDTSAADAGSFQ
jgi:hypothetical protein